MNYILHCFVVEKVKKNHRISSSLPGVFASLVYFVVNIVKYNGTVTSFVELL